MAQTTYKDVLDYLGLENWQFIGLLLVLLAIWAVFVVFYKVGAINKIQVNRIKLSSFEAVYISFEGSYDQIGTIFSQCRQDFQMVFKFSSLFAIYYDTISANIQQNPNRALIGIVINSIERSKIELFLSKFPMYKRGIFAASECLLVRYPLVNTLSTILVIGRVYPEIEKKLAEMKLQLKYKQILQIYHQQDKDPFISVIKPIQNEDCFQKWYQPTDYSRTFLKKHS